MLIVDLNVFLSFLFLWIWSKCGLKKFVENWKKRRNEKEKEERKKRERKGCNNVINEIKRKAQIYINIGLQAKRAIESEWVSNQYIIVVTNSCACGSFKVPGTIQE